MSTTMLLYKKVTALSREEHKGLKIKGLGDAKFASHIHFTPIAGTEFYPLSRHYPIVFIQNGTDEKTSEIVPIALLGLQADTNEYMDENGKWREGIYVPAFIRRYPFVLANTPDKQDEFTVCFDADYKGFNDKEGQALFNEDGTNSPMLDEVIGFMNGFNGEMQRTREFIDMLKKFDLFETKSAEIKNGEGVAFQVQDFLVVDEEKFAKLLNYQLAELHKAGFLGWIYAHLISIGNLTDLFNHHLKNKAKDKAKK